MHLFVTPLAYLSSSRATTCDVSRNTCPSINQPSQTQTTNNVKQTYIHSLLLSSSSRHSLVPWEHKLRTSQDCAKASPSLDLVFVPAPLTVLAWSRVHVHAAAQPAASLVVSLRRERETEKHETESHQRKNASQLASSRRSGDLATQHTDVKGPLVRGRRTPSRHPKRCWRPLRHRHAPLWRQPFLLGGGALQTLP